MAPKTRTEPVIDILHGMKIEDRYRWLEKDSPERDAWIAAQNWETESILNDVPQREAFRKRFTEFLVRDIIFPPDIKGNHLFYTKRSKTQKQDVFCTRQWPHGEEKVLIDPNALDAEGRIAIAGVEPTEKGNLIAYQLNKDGSDFASMHVMNIHTGQTNLEMPRIVYTGAVWLPDEKGFYYGRSPHTTPEEIQKNFMGVYFHTLGTDWRNDPLIFNQGVTDTARAAPLKVSDDGKYLLIGLFKGWTERELYLLQRETNEIQHISQGKKGNLEATIENDSIYIRTDHAGKEQICAASLDDPLNWRTIVPSREDGVITAFSVVKDRLFVHEQENVVSRIKEYTANGDFTRDIELPGLGSASVPDGEPHAIFMTFNSFTQPRTTYLLKEGNLVEFQRSTVPFDPTDYKTEQVWYESKDGTKIPMFVISRNDIVYDGSNPTILYGYGGFNQGMTPEFSSMIAVWIEQGGIYAVPSLRGGNEFGEEWHKAGMFEKKQNVFDDFIAAGEALTGERPVIIDNEQVIRKYTSRHRIGIEGGSNGGLLTGAAVVQRRDLWGAVDCEVPLLDMLRYHFPQGAKYWAHEYGSAEDPEQFKYLLEYSPYHNVQRGQYPPTLFQTALGDDRGVDPMHAMKMAALLQERNASVFPIMLKVKKNTGHGHSKPVSMVVEELSETLAFFAKYLM